MARLFARTCRLGLAGAVLLSATLAVPLGISAQSRQLRLVSTTWPPFTGAAGQPRYALDLVEAALGKIDIGATSVFVDAARYNTALVGPAYDGSAAAWKDPQRERVLLFSEPYLENRLVLVGRRGADVSATTLAALKGRRIAIVEGYSYGSGVEGAGPAFVRSQGEEDSLRQLLASKVDYALMDELVVNYLVENHAEQAQARLQLGTTALITRPLYLAVSRSRPDAQAIIDRFNGQLRGMIADRTYHRLLHVEWIRADVDGDGTAELIPQSDRVGTSEPQRAYAVLSSEHRQRPEDSGAPPRRRRPPRSPGSTSAATSTATGRRCRRATASSTRLEGPAPGLGQHLPLRVLIGADSPRASHGRAAAERLQLQLKTGLEEVRLADHAEAVERAVAVDELEPDVVRHVPVDHRRDAPELAAVDRPVVDVAVREATDQLPGAWPAIEHRA